MSKRKCTFNDELKAKFPCFDKVENSKFDAFCKVCNVKVSVANKGKFDLEQHIQSQKHSLTIRSGESSRPIDSFYKLKTSKVIESAAAVEATLAFHTVKHNFSFRSTDCTTSLLKNLFHDSDIAKNISSAKTKTKAIVSNVIAPYCMKNLLIKLENIPFLSLSTDASNHGHEKLFPVVIQFFSMDKGNY